MLHILLKGSKFYLLVPVFSGWLVRLDYCVVGNDPDVLEVKGSANYQILL